MKKLLAIFFAIVMVVTMCTGCRQADRVSYNVSRQADNFNVTRRLAVINARSDEPVFELIGNFALSNTNSSELAITVEVSRGVYKKHYVYLNEWTIYVVEDVSGAYVDPYHYEVNFLPEMIIPVTFISED
jgi:hypothetical protein